MNYQELKIRTNKIIKEYIASVDYDARLCEGIEYILAGGKRLRAAITLAIIEKLQPNRLQELQQACLVSELIHSASLVIDDLPAFDDAKERRGQECVHIAKGEGVAYLLSFHMVAEAVLIIQKLTPILKTAYTAEEAYQRGEEQIRNVISNLSAKGAIGGQLLSTFDVKSDLINMRDMRGEQEILGRDAICDIIYKKTSTFFEVAMVIGWLVGLGDLAQLENIKEIAKLLGLCYQIYDDYMDYYEDIRDYSHNYVYHRGIDVAYTEYCEYIEECKQRIEQVGLTCPMFEWLFEFMSNRITAEKEKLALCAFS